MKTQKNFLRIFAAVALGVALIFVVLFSYRLQTQQEILRYHNQVLQKEVEIQSRAVESLRSSNLVLLMNNLFNKIDSELDKNQDRSLSDETIARIIALSFSFKSDVQFGRDSSVMNVYSPEKGQLLLALINMNLDSNTFNKIKLKASFIGAELGKANLRNASLNGIDLRGAYLQGADLRGANLIESNLSGANLNGTNLNGAKMQKAILKSVNFKWAEMNEVDMREAVLNGSDLTYAKIRNTNLNYADMKWITMKSAFLNNSKLRSVDFYESNMEQSDFSSVDFLSTRLRRANLTDAILTGADLSDVNLCESILMNTDLRGANLTKAAIDEEKWTQKLNEWGVKGAKEIQDKYQVVDDETGGFDFRLKKKTNN